MDTAPLLTQWPQGPTSTSDLHVVGRPLCSHLGCYTLLLLDQEFHPLRQARSSPWKLSQNQGEWSHVLSLSLLSLGGTRPGVGDTSSSISHIQE